MLTYKVINCLFIFGRADMVGERQAHEMGASALGNGSCELVSALVALQSEMPEVPRRGALSRDGEPVGRYALLDDINRCLRPHLARHGFALSFRTGIGDGAVRVVLRLLHVGGGSLDSELTLPLDHSGLKNPLQAAGSAIAYARRYLIESVLNLSGFDPEECDGLDLGNSDQQGPDPVAVEALEACHTRDELAQAWAELLPESRWCALRVKDARLAVIRPGRDQ
jgi:hypothetical protein